MFESRLKTAPRLADAIVFWITAFGGLVALLLPRIA